MKKPYIPPQPTPEQLALAAKRQRKQNLIEITTWTLMIVIGGPLVVFMFFFPAVVMMLMVLLLPIVAILAGVLGVGAKVKDHNDTHNRW